MILGLQREGLKASGFSRGDDHGDVDHVDHRHGFYGDAEHVLQIVFG